MSAFIVERGPPDSRSKPTLSGLHGAISGPDRRPKLLLGLSIPISAVQFEKHGCIWNSHVGFDYEHSEQLASTIDLRDDLFVWKDTHFRSCEKDAELFSVGTDARSVFLTNKG